ncbi:MAG: VWA domain-containing protein [Planctomycetes bacterium]|nr:VWA domain-containing protein [Planctomycetota bacterium]MCP4770471.1 VWA domain-containing protein [Planctomycetota bacterium]MCP4859911.1 VWA domain-containing protein [Planctomycetota bacterium]
MATTLLPSSLQAQGGRTGRRVPEPSHQALVAQLRDPKQDGATRMRSLAMLAYKSRSLNFKDVSSVHHLARGIYLADYARCLGLCGAEALPELLSLRVKRDEDAAAEVLYARVKLDPEGVSLALTTLRNRKAKDLVRVAALRALADLKSPFALVEALRRLDMESGALLFECLAILRRNPSDDQIPYLIDLMSTSTGRPANEAVAMLQSITGYRIANDPRTWKHFYLKHKADGTPFRRESDGSTEESSLSYMGVPIFSDRIAFAIDSSGSMNERMGDTSGDTRSTRANNELIHLLPRLPEEAQFNVLFFDGEVHSFADGLIPIDPEVQASVGEFCLENLPDGGTNIFAALDSAFSQEGVEEIVLLTDGSPSMGELIEPIEILARVQRYNRWRGVRVSAVALRAPAKSHAFLNRLARENQGVCKVLR